MDLIKGGIRLAQDPNQISWIGPLLVLADAAISHLIVQNIPYTEIDWKSYMTHISQYLSGERNYLHFTSPTGPLVYPGLHVHIYRYLYDLTDAGQNIELAQYIFVALYLTSLALVITTYKQAGAPPWVLPMLVASKRLHSIFMLRLFNDGFAVAFLFAAIACYQRKWWSLGGLLFSAGMAVKMTLFLALPAVGVLLLLGVGRDRAMKQVVIMTQVQVLAGFQFMNAFPYAYFKRAFDFTRQFFFQWTVNWRFVGEDVFLSRPFSLFLLAAHASLLLFFLATRYLRPANATIEDLDRMILNATPKAEIIRISKRVTPDYVMALILSAMAIGCLCARSLHYQFFAYVAWTAPFLLWRSGLHPALVYAIWGAQEWAWNVYPSTNVSSLVVVGCLSATVVASWVALGRTTPIEKREGEHRRVQ